MPKDINMKQMLLKELLDDSLTKTEVTTAFKEIIKLVKKMKERNGQEMKDIASSLQEALKNVKNELSSKFNAHSGTSSSLIENNLKKADIVIKEKIAILEKRLAEVKNGKDADETNIIDAVMNKLEYPTMDKVKKELPVFGEAIRDALELLQADERLEMSAINGLEKLLEELKKEKAVVGKGGGGFSYIAMDRHFADDETPSGTMNGTNKAFTIAKAPNPTASLKVFLNGARQKTDIDFTLSGKTITLASAPEATETILVDYRF